MSPAVAPAKAAQNEPMTEQSLHWLGEHILRDRFLPSPPPERVFVGDGAFLPIGVEFLKWFVRLGALAPYERVLDVGSGIGRMAIPLTQYLEAGSYDGVDVVDEGVAWCKQNITSRYENFRFHRLDLAHPIYNPNGKQTTTNLRLPFKDATFDFVFMTSVVPHLHTADVRAYAHEIRRVMAPDARFFVTAFMLNGPAREALQAKRGAYPFAVEGAAKDRELYADLASPLAAVAFDEDFLLSLFLAVGLRRYQPPIYGRWSGRATPGPSFQDINLLRIDPSIRSNAASGAK
jgi:SAM-dependent methyltransferase